MKPSQNKGKLPSAVLTLLAAAGFAIVWFIIFWLKTPSDFIELPYTGESLAIAQSAGTFRSPGLPLYTRLTSLAFDMPNPARAANIFTALIASLTLCFVFLTASNLVKKLHREKLVKFTLFNPTTHRLILASITTLALAASKLFGISAVVLQPFTLNLFFLSLIIFFWSNSLLKLTPYTTLLLGLVTGIGLAHSHVILMVLPLLIHVGVLYALKKRYASVGWILFGVVGGLGMSYLLLLVGLKPEATYSWLRQADLNSLARFIFSPSPGERFNAFQLFAQPLSQLGPAHIVGTIRRYLMIMPSVMAIMPLLLALLGVLFSVLSKKHYFTSVLITFILFLLYTSTLIWPDSWETRAILYQHYLISFPLITIASVLGLQFFINRLGKGIAILTGNKTTAYILILLISIPIVLEALIYFPQTSISKLNFSSEYAQNIYENTADSGLITCYTNFSCGALLAEWTLQSDSMQKEVFPITFGMVKPETERRLTGFDFNAEPWLFLDLISWNIDDRSVYAADLNQNYFSALGFDYNLMYYLPRGYAAELTQSLPQEIPEYEYTLTREVAYADIPTWNASLVAQKMMFSRAHIFNGISYIKMGLRQRGKNQITLASNLLQDISAKERDEILFIGTQVERLTSQENYAPGSQVRTADYYLDLIPGYFEDDNISRAFLAAKAAFLINPRDARSHLALAKVFERTGDLDFARIELGYALKLDPTLEEAKTLLNQISETR